MGQETATGFAVAINKHFNSNNAALFHIKLNTGSRLYFINLAVPTQVYCVISSLYFQFFINNNASKSQTISESTKSSQDPPQCPSTSQIISSESGSVTTKKSIGSRRNSIDLYEEAAAILGLTCSQTDNCKCIECQVRHVSAASKSLWSVFRAVFKYGRGAFVWSELLRWRNDTGQAQFKVRAFLLKLPTFYWKCCLANRKLAW